MPIVTAQLPARDQDPWYDEFAAAWSELVTAVSNIVGIGTPLPLAAVGVAGTATGAVAAADHVHPHTGLATLVDLDNAVITGGGVPPSRRVDTGTGLTGGGDISEDRTLSVAFGTGAGTAAAGDDARIVGAVQSATTAAATTTAVLAVKLAADLVSRIAIRADGTVSHGEAPLAVEDVTGTSTVTVTTTTDHGYGTGDVVTIAGIESFTGANGTFTVTRTGADTFTLDGATGSGTYSTGGTTQRVLGGTGSANEGTWNLLLPDTTRDGLVVRGRATSVKNLFLARDYLGNPIFAVGQVGGAGVFGDALRVFAGGDVVNPEVHLRPDGTIRGRKGDPAGGVGVLALGDATTVPTADPDGTHTVDGATTVAGAVAWSRGGRPAARTSAGHVDELLAPVRRHTASVAALGVDTTLVATGTPAPTVATTNITPTVDNTATGPKVSYATTAASGVDAGVISAFGLLQRHWAPYLYARISTDPSTITSTRLAVGMVSAEIAADAGPATSGAYTVAAGAWLRYDTAVDGTAFWRTVTSDGANATVTTTSAAIAANLVYELAIEVNAAGTAIRFWVNDFLVATHTTNLPGASTALGYTARLRTLDSARALRFGRITWSSK